VNIDFETAGFLAVAAAGLLMAMAALLSREVVHTIMWLAGFFASLAMIFFLLLAPFLGILELAVYAGAVTILFLFAVMVIKKRIFSEEAVTGVSPTAVFMAVVVAFLITELALQLSPTTPGRSYGVNVLSQNLFADNGAWVIALGIIMLSALVGGVYLAKESHGKPIKEDLQ
jgi:NADH-quinone oxidoreductase subunit J